MGVFIVCYKECNLNQYDILKVNGKRCIHNTSFSCLAPEIVTAVNYFQVFISNNTVLLAQCSSLTSSSSCKVELSCRFFIQITTIFIKSHILATFMAIDMAKQYNRNLWVGSKCNEFPGHVWHSFENDWWKWSNCGN